ncbi:MAG: prolipoprotein diacylglyceryl transferase [Bacillota bacterium]|nr:prolipoprotein diacylglyceryl transferase [Bacillota bacterium]
MPVPNPVAFTIFNIDVMWYGIIITAGIIAASVVCCRRAPSYNLTADRIVDFLIICIPAAIIGARLYYVIFNWSMYSGDFSRIINIRLGGLAIHGGLIAGITAAVILCYIYKIRPFKLLDLIAPSVALGQAIGRWGNYFNSEAHGGPTDLPWAVTVNGIKYHPTFLYESIWCFLLFIFLICFDRYRNSGNHTKFDGQLIFIYGILYSLERFFVEGLRTDSLMIGPLKQAQVISIVILLICLIMYYLFLKKCLNIQKK